MAGLLFFVTPVALGVLLAALVLRPRAQLLSVFAHLALQAAIAALAFRSEVSRGFLQWEAIPALYGIPSLLLLLLLVLLPRSVRSRAAVLFILTPLVLIGGYMSMATLLIYAGWLRH